MKLTVAVLITAAMIGCEALLDVNNKPTGCGESVLGYEGYPDSIPTTRTMHCREIRPGVWIHWFEYTPVDSIPH